MPRAAALLLVLCLAPAARAEEPAAGKLDPKEVARLKQEMALRAEIPKAVGRGVAWLLRQQAKDGSFSLATKMPKNVPSHAGHIFGKTALGALTLAHIGMAPTEKPLADALGYLRKHWKSYVRPKKKGAWGGTYQLSIFAMVLHAVWKRHGKPPEGDAITKNPGGLPPRDLEIVRSIGKWLLKTRAPGRLFGYPSNFTLPKKMRRQMGKNAKVMPVGNDMSNTQYALLGLWACARCGFKVPQKDLVSIAEALMKVQSRSGAAVKRELDPRAGERQGGHVYAGVTDRARGFSYAGSSSAFLAQYTTGSMTAGGLSSLLIAKALLREANALEERMSRRLDRGIWDAIGWFTKYYKIDSIPTHLELSGLPEAQAKLFKNRQMPVMGGMWHRYYLYGLERAMVIAGKRFIGTHDWYLDGAGWLVDNQAKGGHWPKPVKSGGKAAPTFMTGMPVVETCFALLFLKRATLRPRAPLIQVRKEENR